MITFNALKAFQISLGIAVFALGCPAAYAQAVTPNMADPCYGPTKELTADLRKNFVEEVRALAVKAERDHGVPASILLAMSVNESGYGTTQLAIAANNVLSYKWPGKNGPGGRPLFTLKCQPESDKLNVYVVFRDRADSANFVANQLATSKYYKAATDAYRASLASGTDRKIAAKKWFETIAPTYNPYHTKDYIAAVYRAADDPVWQSGKLVDGNAWAALALSAFAQSVDSRVNQVKEFQAKSYAIKDSTNGCPTLTSDLHGWPAALLRDCIFSEPVKKAGQPTRMMEGRVILLKVRPETISTWISTACDEQLPGVAGCFNVVLVCGNYNSSMHFPVAGNMIEDMGSGNKNWTFRNGMTVRMKDQEIDNDIQIEKPWRDTLIELKASEHPDYIKYIKSGNTRFWRTDPQNFARKFPTSGAPKSLLTFDEREKWLDMTRVEMLNALDSPRNRLLDAWIFSVKDKVRSLSSMPDFNEKKCPG